MTPTDATLLKRIKRLFFLLSYFKIPLIGYVRPRIIELDSDVALLRIKLRRRSRNHLGSMYFGALAVGADVAAGLHAFYFAEKHGRKVSFAFKGMECEFLKRAESNVFFRTNDGPLMEKAILQSIETGERVNQPIKVVASNTDEEVVAEFTLISSVKCK